MKISISKPPIWDLVHAKFPLIDDRRTVYTYGDTLYNPAGGYVDSALMAHEETHMRQQAKTAPDAWWIKYAHVRQFRFEEEVEAYKNQASHFAKTNKDRNAQARFVWVLAEALAGPMYDLNITHTEAQRAIRTGICHTLENT